MNPETTKSKLLDIHNKMVFNEKKHTYNVGDIFFTSVTTLIGKYAPFDREEVLQKQSARTGRPVEEISAEWDAAADYGTYIHKFAEDYVNGFTKKPMGKHLEVKQAVVRAVKLFRTKYVYLLPEVRIFNSYARVAGTIDLIGIKEDGSVDIYDWKTNAKGISMDNYGKMMLGKVSHVKQSKFNGYALQLATYKRLLNFWKIDVGSTSLVHLSKEAKIIDTPPMNMEATSILLDVCTNNAKLH